VSVSSTPHGGARPPNQHATGMRSTDGERDRADFATLSVVVLTTSYPRGPDDVAGVFVRDAVEHLLAAGVAVEVVSPASFRHFGLGDGHGVLANTRRRPWLVPPFLASYALAARRAARGADLVHAHWLPSALPALLTRKPFVVQLWGTDVELARRLRRPARRLLRRARLVLAASEALADDARRLGAREVAIVPSGVRLPDDVVAPADPPHVLYVGRLSEEKGIRELVAATEGIPRVVVGDGPLRNLVPDAVGFVPPAELGPYYERAAVVVCPSRREGYGVVAREAMAYGRPVVASAVGGLVDAVEDEVTGLLVASRDAGALRAALERLLQDHALRSELGEAARARALERFSWEAATEAVLAAYRAALEP
jgi:glycosyltransferase involved in cell wall biosynthesis